MIHIYIYISLSLFVFRYDETLHTTYVPILYNQLPNICAYQSIRSV